jgi:hypothetical protein
MSSKYPPLQQITSEKNVQIALDMNRYQKNRESLDAAACNRLFGNKRRKEKDLRSSDLNVSYVLPLCARKTNLRAVFVFPST